jgi:hypothetical protein
VRNGKRLIAFYLPAFYPIPENDEFWEKGWTEWDNVRSAKPLYDGHILRCHPHEDIGYYEMGLDIIHKQQAMAKQYGIDGWGIYYYWFNGRQTFSRTLELIMANKDLDLPFCLIWANEPWTRTWDGNEKDVLLGRTYEEQDQRNLIRSLLPAMKDERCIRVDGRPLLMVSSVHQELKWVQTLWRKECAAAGLPEPFLMHHTIGAKYYEDLHVLDGWDAAYEFPPRGQVSTFMNNHAADGWNQIDYRTAMACSLLREPDERLYRTAFPSWDNSPRKGSKGANVYLGSSPELFTYWLDRLTASASQDIVFVNAWNEWGESATLEPSAVDGYRNLEALTAAALPVDLEDAFADVRGAACHWQGDDAYKKNDMKVARAEWQRGAALGNEQCKANLKGLVRQPVFIISPTGKSGTNFLAAALIELGICKGSQLAEDFFLRDSHMLLRYGERSGETWKRWEGGGEDGPKAQKLTASLGHGLIEFAGGLDSKRHLVLKTPSSESLAHFPRLFPDAKLILLIRDGRDTTESQVKAGYRADHQAAFANWAVQTREFLDFMADHQDLEGSMWKLVRYEDLIREPEATFAEIASWLDFKGGLDISRVAAMPVIGSAYVGSDGWSTLPKPESFNPIGRWAMTWDQKRRQQFDELAGSALVAAGYKGNKSRPPKTRIIAMLTHPGNEEYVRACRETWLSDLPDDVQLIEVYGGGEGEPHFDGVRLTLPVEEHYSKLPQKTWWLCRWLLDNTVFTHVLKCDDDIYIKDVGALFDEAKVYTGLVQRITTGDRMGNYHYQYVEQELRKGYEGSYPDSYAIGCFYILNRNAAHIIASTPMEELEDCMLAVGYEDVMVGKLMADALVGPTMFASEHRLFHYLDPDAIRAFHYATPAIFQGDHYHIVGDNYLNGAGGFEKNEVKAFESWKKGADEGHVQCLRNLAWAYSSGIGVEKDKAKSAEILAYLNSFPEVGVKYGIRGDYHHRKEVASWPLEQDFSAYRFAKLIAERDGLRTALDVSGGELVQAFFEVVESDPDMVISANIIERAADPEELLESYRRLYSGKRLVLATPNRGSLMRFRLSRGEGPPVNPARYREWGRHEFARWLQELFGRELMVHQLRGALMNMAVEIQL